MRTRPYDNDPDRPDDGPSAAPDRFTMRRMGDDEAARHDAIMAEHQRRYLNDPEYRAARDAADERVTAMWAARNRERAEAWCRRNGIELDP